MDFTDHQVRQFYVVDGTHTATPVVSNHKFYVKYIDPSDKPITSDKIDSGCIRDIRITKQPGWTPKVWVIVPNTPNANVSNTYVLHMLFRNVFGGGIDDFYVKDPAIVVPAGAKPSDICTKLADAINKDFSTETSMPFTVSANSTSVILVENTPNYDTIRGIHRVALDLRVTVDEANMTGTYQTPIMNDWGNVYSLTQSVGVLPTFSATSDYTVGDFVKHSTKVYMFVEAYDHTVSNAWDSNKVVEIGTVASLTSVNGPEVCDMEYFFSKGRADLFGYMGFPDINPSKMVASTASDYYILDIKYFYQEAGVNNQNSEKELSFACTDKSTLETVITDIVASTTGTTLSGGRECEIYAPKAY